MINSLKLVSTVFLLLLVCSSAFNQEIANTTQKETLTEDSYNELLKELDYSETKRVLRPKPNKKKGKNSDLNRPETSSWNIPGIGSVFSVLAYALIFLLVGALLFVIFNNVQIDKKINTEVEVDEEEIEDIEDVDVSQKFSEALANGDYRSAIRWRFLNVLQILSLKKIILWKPDKTNRDYNREITDIELKNKFRQLALYYENVWYGDMTIDQDLFKTLDPHFENFIKNQNV